LKDINDKLKETIEETFDKLIIDKTRISGQTICSLTQEEYKDPYYLNLTGRSYEFEAIKKAIETHLYNNENLRLEDITLTPEMIDRIVLVPNFSISKNTYYHRSNSYKFDSNKIKKEPFNIDKLLKNNIPKFSNEMRNILEKDVKREIWNYEEIWEIYATYRDLNSKWPDEKVYIRDIQFDRINLIRNHPKCNTGHVTFKNCKFSQSVLNVLGCWCGVSFEDCLFENCKLVYDENSNFHHKLKHDGCLFQNCKNVGCKDEKTIPWL